MSQGTAMIDFRGELCLTITAMLRSHEKEATPSPTDASLRPINGEHYSQILWGPYTGDTDNVGAIFMKSPKDDPKDKITYVAIDCLPTIRNLQCLLDALWKGLEINQKDIKPVENAELNDKTKVFQVKHSSYVYVATKVGTTEQDRSREPFVMRPVKVNFVLDLVKGYVDSKLGLLARASAEA